MRAILLLAIIPFLMSCTTNNQKETQEITIGKYVYLDDAGIIHSDGNCTKLKFGRDENGHSIYAKEFIDTIGFNLSSGPRFCARCIDDKTYEHLQRIAERNIANQVEEYRHRMYDCLVSEGYDMDFYEQFCKDLEAVPRRRRLYDLAYSRGWTNDSFNIFSDRLGM